MINFLKIPRHNANDEKVLITKHLIKDYDIVKKNQPVLEIETSKVTYEVESDFDGFIKFISGEENEIEIEAIYAIVSNNLEELRSYNSDNKNPNKNKNINLLDLELPELKLSDKAKQLYNKDGDNFSTENTRWVTSRHHESGKNDNNSNKSINDYHKTSYEEKIDLNYNIINNSKRKIIEIDALREAPTGQFQSSISIEILANHRKKENLVFVESIQDLVIFETYKLLKNDFSDLNRFYISDDKVGKYESVFPGISLDKRNSLIVCKINENYLTSLENLQNYLANLFVKYDENKINEKDLNRATFTVSDLSNTKTKFMIPLINGYQTIIIGITKTHKNAYNVIVTFDHRVTEGLRIAKFLEILKIAIENYYEDSTEFLCSFCMKTLDEELSHGNRGLIKLVTHDGEQLICNNCFIGW